MPPLTLLATSMPPQTDTDFNMVMQTFEESSNMSDLDKVHEIRLNQHAETIKEMKDDLKEIKTVVQRLDKKLAGIPESGLPCPIHQLKIDDFGKRLDTLEIKTESIHTKIIAWTAIASVIIFLLTQLLIPYVLSSANAAESAPSITQTDNAAYWSQYQKTLAEQALTNATRQK